MLCVLLAICGHVIVLIALEYLTLSVFFRYGMEGHKWDLFARLLAIGLACLILLFAWFPIELLLILRGVVRELEKVPSNEERQATVTDIM